MASVLEVWQTTDGSCFSIPGDTLAKLPHAGRYVLRRRLEDIARHPPGELSFTTYVCLIGVRVVRLTTADLTATTIH